MCVCLSVKILFEVLRWFEFQLIGGAAAMEWPVTLCV